MKRLRLIIFGLSAGLTACAAGPGYRMPKPDVPPSFASPTPTMPVTAGVPAPTPGADLANWWRVLHDEELDSLVERAVRSNLDIEIALDRLQQARTYEAAIIGNALPEADATAAAGRGTGTDLTKGRAEQGLVSAD